MMNPNMYPQAPQRPAAPGVDVQVSYAWRAGCMSAIGGTVLLFTIAVVVWSFLAPDAAASDATSGGPTFHPAALVFPIFGLLWFVPLIIFAGEKARIPQRIDPSGVTMRNGARMPWNEYRGVRPHIRRAAGDTRGTEWALELMFARGSALVVYRPIQNLRELAPVLDALKYGRNPWG